MRFLAHATFGATADDVAHLSAVGYQTWMNEQFQKPAFSFLQAMNDQLGPVPDDAYNRPLENMLETFWQRAIQGDDQLRLRMAYALSQIFVVSGNEPELADRPHGVAFYFDALVNNAFGNFRSLLEDVTYNPGMGRYLTYLGNRGDSGRSPDENYARELMQLMSIGLYQLNIDGSPKLVDGKPVPTYGDADVRGLAKVMTGLDWGNPKRTAKMIVVDEHHTSDPKTFLGVTIPAGTKTAESLRVALDTVFNHPNVGPFIGLRLIQHFVKSNPSPAYIERVARAFNGEATGVRGDMKAVLVAVLFDPEALDPGSFDTASAGKLRETTLRVTGFFRASVPTIRNGWSIGYRQILANNMVQPLLAPSVFNFYKPRYTPPGSALETGQLVAPEFQMANELSIAGYANWMQSAVERGVGPLNDFPHVVPEFATELQFASDSKRLVDYLDLFYTGKTMSADTKAAIVDSVDSVANADALNRVRTAVFMTLVSPEYLVQR